MKLLHPLTGLGLLLLLACARILAPPGGPTDRAPPRVVSTVPESLEVRPDFRGEVEFRFDGVVSEGGSPNFGLGTGDLERLIILSPSTKVPAVHWRRDRITTRPREGWRPNRVYRIELLPGVADLAGNRIKTGRIVTFTTGAPVPKLTLRGRVVDWSTRLPKPQATVEAVLLPDSLSYRTSADSTGRFALGPLPAGEYLVYGVIDQNNNLRLDAREAFDSVRLAAGRDSAGEIWAFKHDTIAARVTTTAVEDSLSIGVTFSMQLDPYQLLPPDSVTVRQLPDSLPVKVVAILPKEIFDTAFAHRRPVDTLAAADTARVRARADSLRADSVRADSARRAREAAEIRIPGAERRRGAARDTAGTGPLRTKPPLFDRLIIRVAERLKPGVAYTFAIQGLRSVSRRTGTVVGGIKIPEPKAVADTAKARADSLKTKRDSVPRKKP